MIVCRDCGAEDVYIEIKPDGKTLCQCIGCGATADDPDTLCTDGVPSPGALNNADAKGGE